MPNTTVTAAAVRFQTELLTLDRAPSEPGGRRTEEGFEIAQSMGIALLGLVVAAAFATALEALGVDVITRIRSELGL